MEKVGTMHKEKQILFSGSMVRALLSGSKTQTRRIVKPQPSSVIHKLFIWKDNATTDEELIGMCPYGQPGDRLWVREAWQTHCDKDGITPCDLPTDSHVQYPATYDGWVSKKRPSIHMPRWASRINLEITGVRVERLQDISEEDAIAEGVMKFADNFLFGLPGWEGHPESLPRPDARSAYVDLWESLNGAGSWDANPWVWVVEFRRLTNQYPLTDHPPVDETGNLHGNQVDEFRILHGKEPGK